LTFLAPRRRLAAPISIERPELHRSLTQADLISLRMARA
jgi:hypothetical protein